MIKNISKCRVCGSDELSPIMSLGEQALTGVFPKRIEDHITSGPLDLVRCSAHDGCGLVQLKQSYDLSEMYGMNYGYRSGLNPSMVRHLQDKVHNIIALDILRDGDLVIDIGSNDATTLRAYPTGKYQLVGVDPTGIKFSEYYPPEIKLISDFFSSTLIHDFLDGKKAKIITSFSMFYDLEDPVGFAQIIESTLHDEGMWIFEQSYLPAMLQANSFDTICHEHLEFYALRQILYILHKAKLKIVDVEFNDVNGGSFSVTAAKVDSSHEVDHDKINQILATENALGLNSTVAVDTFRHRIDRERASLLNFLTEAKASGKRVCGLGASTKGNVLLQYYGIGQDLIECVGEVNEDKFGSFTPGSLIPIVSEDQVLKTNPDYLLILPWHFRKFFEFAPRLKGRTLVFPLPYFEIVTTK
ncbi:MAG: methyltransferase domain-containing protein [Sphingomonadales bacterium]|nr:methyltransferase domain-containing protein [Sphingomonadales bacterium]